MQAIVIHGMGRTPVSQFLLARRLRAAGIRVSFFGYSTLRPFATSVRRLAGRILALGPDEPFILIGHSLGCLLIRAAVPMLNDRQPAACFLLAPPNRVSRAARFFGRNPLYRLLTRDAGQLLSDDSFMASLPIPSGPLKIYAGTAGLTGQHSPFRDEPNDGILAVSETFLSPSHAPVLVPALHTFIMNSAFVASDIVSTVESLTRQE
jgi:pimeloyl-ACP methyl ester carboxylesterase